MACTPGGCSCGHEHGGHEDASQQDHGHGTGCCGGPAVNDDTVNPKVAEKA